MVAKAELGGVILDTGSQNGSDVDAQLADNLDNLEKKVMDLTEELEKSKGELDTVKFQKKDL